MYNEKILTKIARILPTSNDAKVGVGMKVKCVNSSDSLLKQVVDVSKYHYKAETTWFSFTRMITVGFN